MVCLNMPMRNVANCSLFESHGLRTWRLRLRAALPMINPDCSKLLNDPFWLAAGNDRRM